MKQIITALAFLIGFSISAEAQNIDYNARVGVRDTLTNSQASTRTLTIKGAKNNVTLQVVVRKISGTVAGYIQYYYSIDGGTSYYLAEVDTLTDATNSYTYEKAYNPGQAYKVIVTSTGTSVSSTELWTLYRRD